MSSYTINFEWKNESGDYSYEKYPRAHEITFGGKQILNNSASPEYFGNADMSNPEELLAGALGTCHMMTFLAIAAKTGFSVTSYTCKAEAVMGKTEEGRICVSEINLSPVIKYAGKTPTAEQLQSMHEKSHQNCFIAQSLHSKVNVL